jgi:hypothetical protein
MLRFGGRREMTMKMENKDILEELGTNGKSLLKLVLREESRKIEGR